MGNALLVPNSLKALTLKDRVYSQAHAPLGYPSDGLPAERYAAAYHEERARGGLSLTMIGGASNVDVDSAIQF